MGVLSLGFVFINNKRITEAFGLPKLSLFSNYKVMLLLCLLELTEFKFKSYDTYLVADCC